jgi:hypothetical protein
VRCTRHRTDDAQLDAKDVGESQGMRDFTAALDDAAGGACEKTADDPENLRNLAEVTDNMFKPATKEEALANFEKNTPPVAKPAGTVIGRAVRDFAQERAGHDGEH